MHKSYRTEPKFRRTFFSFHMNMWRFISLVAVEEEPIRPNDFHCGHYYESLSHRPCEAGYQILCGFSSIPAQPGNAQAAGPQDLLWAAVSFSLLLGSAD
ncbi:MAG TPA: hypothetical protein VIH42_02355 [Thermoguttaceae bacterium]